MNKKIKLFEVIVHLEQLFLTFEISQIFFYKTKRAFEICLGLATIKILMFLRIFF